jgi:hypothetical protein
MIGVLLVQGGERSCPREMAKIMCVFAHASAGGARRTGLLLDQICRTAPLAALVASMA